MNNSLFNNIIKTSIPVLNNSGVIVSYAFIIEFPVQNEKDKVIPFLVINYNDVRDLDKAILAFNVLNNSVSGKYNVSFDQKFIQESHINDYVVHPIAGFLNDAISKGMKIEYLGLHENHIMNTDNQTTRSVETLSYITYRNIGVGSDSFPVVNQTNNLTPFYGDNKDFFLMKGNANPCGYPVLVAEEGSFFNGNGLCLGSRVVFAGVAIRNVNDLVLVKYPKDLVDCIKSRFKNLFGSNKTNE